MRNVCKVVWLAAIAGTPGLLQAQTACSNATLSGTYFYVLNGDVFDTNLFGYFVPYAELGKFTADGNGGITGQTTNNVVGYSAATSALSGSYAVQGNCTGTLVLNTGAVAMQIAGGGESVLLAPSSANYGVSGQAYRAASTSCTNASFTGTYSYLQSGGYLADQEGDIGYYSEVGQLTADGNGNLTTTNVANAGGGASSESGSGTYAINSDCSGTATVTYSATASYNYNLAIAAGHNILILETDSGNAIAGTGQLQSPELVLPQFVFGGGTWYSALYFTNSNGSSVSFAVNFTADDGTPLTVPSLGVSSASVTIAANGTAVLEAPNTGAFGEGYATFTLPAGVTGYGIFRQGSGTALQEAAVPFAGASSMSSKLTWDETAGTVSVAVANPSNAAGNLTITVFDTSGNLLGTSQPIALSAYNKIGDTLDHLTGLSLRGQRGSALFSVSTGNVALLGLRFINQAFTSVPATGN